MNKIIFQKNILRGLLIALLCLGGMQAAMAQADRFDANFSVAQKTFGKNSKPKYGKVRYHVCNTYKMAQDYADLFRAAIRQDNAPGGSGTELDNAISKQRFQMKESRVNGTFTARVEDGMGVVVIGDDGAEAVEIHAGKTDYDVLVQGMAAFEISEVDVTARRKIPVFKKVPSLDTGYEVNFNINAYLQKGITSQDTRIIVQPMIIDCQTDDTIDYMRPLVFEGMRYHKLQNRRMRFHYYKNDPLNPAFSPVPIPDESRDFVLDTNVVYRKKEMNREKTYKCAYYVTVEDYTHKIYDNGGAGTGSCLSFRPFKFLDFNVAAAQMPLTSEFYDQAESHVRDVPRNLKLRFEVGTATLTRDSVNDKILDGLTRELRSYGDRLTQIRIEGAASPEGSKTVNQQLAANRANLALSMLRRRLGNKVKYIRIPAPTVTLHTWSDVATTLDEQGQTALAQKVRDIVAKRGEDDAYGDIHSLPEYQPFIVPVLEQERVMKCSYQYEVDHVMDASEAVSEYLGNRADYQYGRKDMSDGDFYHLFETITDPAEQDTLTEVAWRHTSKQPAYWMLRLSPYVANRKALLNMRKGNYDTNVLRPFIDFNITRVDQEDRSTGMIINRREILLNQAINYFQQQQLDTAQYIIDLLNKNGADSATMRVERFVTFVRAFFQANRTPEEEAAFQDAMGYVLGSSADNRAIIYSELHQQLGKTRAEAERYVDEMDDSNAKKWYLKGILWADEAGKEPSLDADDGYKPLTDEEFMHLQATNPEALKKLEEQRRQHEAATAGLKSMRVPYHLAYFQHSFDLEPSYRRLYFNEGNVSDDVRKRFPYRSKDIGKYEMMFQKLIAQRDNISKSDESTQESNDNNEPAQPDENNTTEE